MRLTLTRVALVCLLVTLFAGDLLAGPIRDRVRDARPGLLIPKRTAAPACTSCTAAPQAAPPSYQPAPGYQPSAVAVASHRPVSQGYAAPVPNCPGGRCPIPAK